MVRYLFALAFVVCTYATAAAAQPTDNEMFAAYCLGVVEQQAADRTLGLQADCKGATVCEEAKRDSQREAPGEAERLQRLKTYLLLRQGTSPEGQVVRSLAMLKQKGIADTKQCLEGTLANFEKSFRDCREVCSPKWLQEGPCKVCTDKYEPEACRQIIRCKDLSRLPF